jgi:hypothetical protein
MLAATWFGAVATFLLVIGAGATVYYAKQAFDKQSAELTTLKEHADDERETNKKLAAAAELQAKELEQSLADRQADRERQHRAQAEQVYITIERTPGHRGSGPGEEDIIMIARLPAITSCVHNYSQQIIRDVQLQWHKGSASHGEPNPEPLGELIPGADTERERQFPADADLEQCGAVVVFRDAAGTRWLRRPDGDLQEQMS